MAEPFLAEIRMMAFNYAPTSQGWALCNGQFLPINQNQALFSLLGTTFGGNGQTTFALPDLRGQTPIHVGQGFVLGQKGGEQAHTLSSCRDADAHACRQREQHERERASGRSERLGRSRHNLYSRASEPDLAAAQYDHPILAGARRIRTCSPS